MHRDTGIERRAVMIGGLAALLGTPALSSAATTAIPSRRDFRAADGTRLSYLTLGRGRPVLLLHGLLGNAPVNWFDTGLAQRIAALGRRVIAPDFRGHGASDKPTDPARYPPDILAADQEDLIRHLRLRNLDLGGYSLGSRMCVRLLARGLRPRQACLGGMGDTGITDVAIGRIPFEDYVLNGPKAKSPAIGAIVQRMMQRFDVTTEPIMGVLRQQVSTPLAALRAIETPILLLCGNDDSDNGSASGLLALLPRARLERTPGNHLTALTTPEFQTAFSNFFAL